MPRFLLFCLLIGFFSASLSADEQKAVGHWSFEPVKRPDLPGATANPVDMFLEKRLRACLLFHTLD